MFPRYLPVYNASLFLVLLYFLSCYVVVVEKRISQMELLVFNCFLSNVFCYDMLGVH